MNELNGAQFGGPIRQPVLMAVGVVAIAALGLSGLYQGFRFTWRDYGPAPSYAQIVSAATQVAPQPVADPQIATVEARDDAPAKPDDAALDAAATPPLPLAASVQAAIDGMQSPSVAAGADVAPGRDAAIQPAAYSAPAGPAPDQTAAAPGSSTASPSNNAPGQAPAPPPQ